MGDESGAWCILKKELPPKHVQCVQTLRDFVLLNGDHDATHGAEHAMWVTYNVTQLVKQLGMTDERFLVVVCAAMLHDVLDGKYISKEDGSFNEVKQSMITLLTELLQSSTYAAQVLEITENCSFSKEKKGLLAELEPDVMEMRNIVSDADKLE